MCSYPFFSIVVVNFNGSKFLEDAILSILNQNFKDFELIIIDGGSSDGSIEIINKYKNKIAYWISEPDKGQSDAFNKGFAQARGVFYLWLNSDDILLPNSLKIANLAIENNKGYKWFAANTIFINDKSIILNCARGPNWRNFFIKNGVIYVYGPSSIFHKSLFLESGGFDLNLHYTMDTDLWMRFKNMGYEFKRIPYYFWAFRIHSGSKTSHSFSGSLNKAFKDEQEQICIKNSHFYSRSSYYKQVLFKLFSGTFIFSKLDTFVSKGKYINEFYDYK